MDADTYNRPSFPLDMDEDWFTAFRQRGPRVGARAPDGDLVDAATGETTTLSALGKGAPLIIEFGSFT